MSKEEYRPQPSKQPEQHKPHQEAGNGVPGIQPVLHERAKPPPESQEGNPPVSPLEQKEAESATKPSRIPAQKIVFVQHAFASGAAERLDERRRLFLAHAVTKPHLTLQELAPFAGVRTAERARQLWDSGLQTLRQASPPELQQQHPLDQLQRHRLAGVPFSAERRLQMSAARKGKHHAPETRAKIAASNTGKKRSPEQRAHIREGQQGRQFTPEHKARIGAAKQGKKRSPETRARISAAIRQAWERRKQQDGALTHKEQEQHEAIPVSPFPQKT